MLTAYQTRALAAGRTVATLLAGDIDGQRYLTSRIGSSYRRLGRLGRLAESVDLNKEGLADLDTAADYLDKALRNVQGGDDDVAFRCESAAAQLLDHVQELIDTTREEKYKEEAARADEEDEEDVRRFVRLLVSEFVAHLPGLSRFRKDATTDSTANAA